MTDLILWRHGQTDYNLQGRIQGRVDIPLNDTGREQARRAADCIAALGPTRIVSSPLARARATAEVLASLTGLSVEIDQGLAEKSFGDWEGLKAADIKKQWPDHYATWRAGGDLPRTRGADPNSQHLVTESDLPSQRDLPRIKLEILLPHDGIEHLSGDGWQVDVVGGIN